MLFSYLFFKFMSSNFLSLVNCFLLGVCVVCCLFNLYKYLVMVSRSMDEVMLYYKLHFRMNFQLYIYLSQN